MSKTFGTVTARVSSISSCETSATADYLAIGIAAALAGTAALVGAFWLATAGSTGSSMAENWRAPVGIMCKAEPAHHLAVCPECALPPQTDLFCGASIRRGHPKP